MNDEYHIDETEHPLTLKNLAYYSLIKTLDVISTKINEDIGRQLNDEIRFPKNICEDFIRKYQEFGRILDDDTISLFHDIERTSLKDVHLYNTTLSDEGLEILLRHKLHTLSLWHCDKLTTRSYQLLSEYGESLKALQIGYGTKFVNSENPYESRIPADIFAKCLNLKQIVLHNKTLIYGLQLFQLHELTHLDLSLCNLITFNFQNLLNIPNLQNLILFNVRMMPSQINVIYQLSKLKFLDISYINFQKGILEKIITNLPELIHLDISGTNLIENELNIIPEIMCRKENPLAYLGLYQTSNSACQRQDIPANEISGNANEEQILTACRYYLNRPQTLSKVLEDLLLFWTDNICREKNRFLDVVLKAIDKHSKQINVCRFGNKVLWEILKDCNRSEFGMSLRNHMLRTFLNEMEIHIDNDEIIEKCFSILLKFRLPIDVIFEHDRLLSILLYQILRTQGDIEKMAFQLINIMTHQIDGREKLAVNDMGIVGIMLDVINARIEENNFDNVLQMAWSILWNVILLGEMNCGRFAENHGASCVVRYLNAISFHEELLGAMLKSLLHVTTVSVLRPLLMTTELVKFISRLLASNSHQFLTNYCAVGILANFALDGPENWRIATPKREDVLIQITQTVNKWDLNNEHSIRYPRLTVLFRLIQCYETPQCQHWSIWAVANLIHRDPVTYCPRVQQKNGIQMLMELINDSRPYKEIKELAQHVINQCRNVT